MDRQAFIATIEEFARRNGLAPATVTSRAVGNSRLYQRLLDGGDCGIRTMDRVVRYMTELDRKSEEAA